MEAGREIYWNIGHEVAPFMYLLAVAAIIAMAAGFRQRWFVWRRGKPASGYDRSPERLKRFMADTIAQRKVLHEKGGGLPHALLFWGFLLLFGGTLLVMLQADIVGPLSGFDLLSGDFYRLFSLTLDLAGLVALLALTGLFVRRFFHPPPDLEKKPEDLPIHLLLSAILLTGFVVEGLRMAAAELEANPDLALWSPVGMLFARLFTALDGDSIAHMHRGLWWFHLLLGLGFIAALPWTRLRHIVTGSGNTFLASLEPGGTFETLDLEDERAEKFGIAQIGDLAWTDLFDADACTRCGRCQERCPAHATGKPLSPMKIIGQIGELAAGRSAEPGLIDTVTREALWACTTCAACDEACPVDIGHLGRIVGMRRNLILMEGEVPGEEVRRAMEDIEVSGNPFGRAPASRGEWAEGLPVTILGRESSAEVLYFAGCYASFDPRNREVARSFVRICSSAGVTVGILGSNERCCGEPARKLGNEYLYRETADKVISAIRSSGVKQIVTTCPHCLTTLDRDYRDLGLDLPVEHSSLFISGLVREQRLKMQGAPFRFTFHDSCHLARYMGIVREPRELLQAAGGELIEMERYGRDGFCCGGGGGRVLAEERAGQKISVVRAGMAKETGTPLLVSACPFCMTMLEDGLRSSGAAGDMKLLDLTEIIASRISR